MEQWINWRSSINKEQNITIKPTVSVWFIHFSTYFYLVRFTEIYHLPYLYVCSFFFFFCLRDHLISDKLTLCPTGYSLLEENKWIHAFPKAVIAKWKQAASSRIETGVTASISYNDIRYAKSDTSLCGVSSFNCFVTSRRMWHKVSF